MKTNLAPKHVRNINDTFLLWFKASNRYVIVSSSVWTLIGIYIKEDTRNSFVDELKTSLQIEDSKCQDLFDDISSFLIDSNTHTHTKTEPLNRIIIPKVNCVTFYKFKTTVIKVNFETPLIQSIIHPQIAHHQTAVTPNTFKEFHIFKNKDYLYLFRNNTYLNHYKTKDLHLLQGRFALELTNAIHKTIIDNWVATFHASTIANSKESIMIIGDSGNGKSTLSALLMADGFDLLADDFTPMYEDMNLYRYPSAISIKTGAFSLLESKIPGFHSLRTHTNGPKKVNLKYVPQNQRLDHKTSNFDCKTIVYVKFDENKRSELNPISVENILQTLIPDSWISPNEKHALKFMNWLSDITCYELSYSNNNFAIRKFKELFDH
ncbi:hypothetical protein ES692_05325 [Psychroserpens burtonensis]|uniref:Serine kinase n=1 Tax=Psychroserpens burtonensis TaxID=49278 RepID=A0A5C7BC58_9FLAO|nr:hypothetical protein [Psychroserpens burtonensis]TXE18873.1 hypothetical protein ES692_05325 [Psychroserpens burtonensis]